MLATRVSKAQTKAAASSTHKVLQQFQRVCTCGGTCPECQTAQHGEDSRRSQTERVQPGILAESALGSTVNHALASPGQPLDPPTRSFFEPRFGHDLSNVRVHTGDEAARSAHALSALAFTFDRHVVFGEGQYGPGTSTGQRLLAHEIAHVVQQRGQQPIADTQLQLSSPGDAREREADAASDTVMTGLSVRSLAHAPRSLQRKCHEAELGKPTPPCTRSDQGVGGWQLLFKVGCDELLPGEEAKLKQLKSGSKVNIHGFASKEGKAEFNDDLSCHRANVVAGLVGSQRPDCQVLGRFRHGASPAVAPGLVPDPHPLEFWRNAIIEEVKPVKDPTDPNQWVNPPVTVITDGWPLYDQAKKNPTPSNLDVLAAHRTKLKGWLESIPKLVAPEGGQLTRKDLSKYRSYYDSAEKLWTSIDQLLAQQNHATVAKDTYAAWAAGEGKDQGSKLHAKNVPTGAKYHIDIFGEGFFPGAVNVGMATRTSTTGVYGSRVPYLIYRRFSGKGANHIPIADHVADLVTSENGPLGLPGLAEEIARIIAPSGVIVLYSPDNMEPEHDKVFKLTGGTITKVFSGSGGTRTIETKIVVPGP